MADLLGWLYDKETQLLGQGFVDWLTAKGVYSVTPSEQAQLNAITGAGGMILAPGAIIPGTGQSVNELKALGYSDTDIRTMLASNPIVMASANAQAALAGDQQKQAESTSVSLPNFIINMPSLFGLTPDQMNLVLTLALVLVVALVAYLIFK